MHTSLERFRFVVEGSSVVNDSWTMTYQELLELEKEKLEKNGDIRFEEPPNPSSFLTAEEVRSACLRNGVDFQQFISSDLLVQYPGFGWRTMHFDLIYRIVHIRNLERQQPIPLEYRIEIKHEPVPDFGRYKFSEVLPELIPNALVREIILYALSKSKYEGLSSHQLPIVKELISKKTKYTTAAIVAPTASGKTLAFFLPIIIKAVERSIGGKTGISSILIYPRKALERDQLQSFLTIIDSINQKLKNQITIGIDDGDTKRLQNINNQETYREMKCIECSGNLVIEKKENESRVKCSKCLKEYNYIMASKDEIWDKKPSILITNIHTIYRRLLSPAIIKMFSGIDYIVFDEAHVYTDYLGGHVFYILKLLRHATCRNGTKPYFVFSSATISNPCEFIASLAGVKADEIFYVDYNKSLEKAQDIKQRIMLYLYLLPHPNSSVETLTEALILAVTLWCHKHNLKAITFVDSIAEISTLSDYIFTTILDKREGREVIDHLFSTRNTSENSYNWFPLAPSSLARDQDTFKHFVLNQFKESIGIHYGQLPMSERARVEYNFSQGLLKLLLSTSTLELGIDLSDVAVIIQHKLPITPEGVVQRIGRSGRSSACLRVALGIIALQSSPLSTIYMFDEKLRGRLADPSMLPPVRVGQASTNIKLQHILSLLLYKRASEGKPTFVMQYLKSKQEVVNAVKEIVNELNEDLLEFNTEVTLFDDKDVLKSQVNELRSLLSAVVNIDKDSNQDDFSQIKERIEKILADIEEKAKNIRQVLQKIDSLKSMLEKIQALDRKVINELERLRDLLWRAYRLCSILHSIARSSYHSGDRSLIQSWYKTNSSDVEMIAKEIPDPDRILSTVHTPLLFYISNVMKGDYKKFRENYGFGFDDVTHTLTSVTTSLGDQTRCSLVSFLKELPSITRFLESVDLQGLTMHESLRRIESELRFKRQGIDIIDSINLLLHNKTKFSLMLEPPSPELLIESVEEA